MKHVIHEHTALQIDRLIDSPSHAVLLIGPKGVGKRFMADYLISRILDIESVEDYPYGKVIQSQDGKAIGIEEIRELEHFLSLKVPGNSKINRFILFENAHLLTGEAQNSVLKTLEEPPLGSLIVLTAEHEQALLPTIRSRTQTVNISPPTADTVGSHFMELGYAESDVKKAAVMSGGLPGLMATLLSEEEHELTIATGYARQILSKSIYERLLMVDELSKQKQLSLNTCLILQQMAHISLQKATGTQSQKWKNVMEAAYLASEQINKNAQPKLVLDKLMLSI